MKSWSDMHDCTGIKHNWYLSWLFSICLPSLCRLHTHFIATDFFSYERAAFCKLFLGRPSLWRQAMQNCNVIVAMHNFTSNTKAVQQEGSVCQSYQFCWVTSAWSPQKSD